WLGYSFVTVTAGNAGIWCAPTGGIHVGKIGAGGIVAADPPDDPFGTNDTSGTRNLCVWAVVGAGRGGCGGGLSATNQYFNQLANGIDMRTMTYASHASLANGVPVGGAAEGALTVTGSP